MNSLINSWSYTYGRITSRRNRPPSTRANDEWRRNPFCKSLGSPNISGKWRETYLCGTIFSGHLNSPRISNCRIFAYSIGNWACSIFGQCTSSGFHNSSHRRSKSYRSKAARRVWGIAKCRPLNLEQLLPLNIPRLILVIFQFKLPSRLARPKTKPNCKDHPLVHQKLKKFLLGLALLPRRQRFVGQCTTI